MNLIEIKRKNGKTISIRNFSPAFWGIMVGTAAMLYLGLTVVMSLGK